MSEQAQVVLPEWEIWIGYYGSVGQGDSPLKEPQKVANVKAPTFKMACYFFELHYAYASLSQAMQAGVNLDKEAHFGRLYYDPSTNSNGWTGKYYSSREEAQRSFSKIITLS